MWKRVGILLGIVPIETLEILLDKDEEARAVGKVLPSFDRYPIAGGPGSHDWRWDLDADAMPAKACSNLRATWR
jgi:hypothetical protein